MSVIDSKQFYGGKADCENEDRGNGSQLSWIKVSRNMPSNILGPTQFWKLFDKQAEAIATAYEESTDSDQLSTFVCQGNHGYRKFIVAHPEVFWWHYKDRPLEKKCSYEVIPEYSPCRLYLDLEYSIKLNSKSDGCRMTNILIDILCSYLLAHWSLPCSRYDIVDLDSTTNEKFSRHLIFSIKDIAFRDNYHAGRLVKTVRKDILDYVTIEGSEHKILSRFDRADIESLLVETEKGKNVFIDTGVYTKNRHFRIYKSTKWGKQSYLTISKECRYIPSSRSNDRELSLFLDSLISFFPHKKDLVLLEYIDGGTIRSERFKGEQKVFTNKQDSSCTSQFSVLDKYICNIISPGSIRLCKYFEDTKTLIYETIGYRYCENIGRRHKSNNVFWVVDLNTKMMYQKCHDEDCTGFKSTLKPLPTEICFHLEDDDDVLSACSTIVEDLSWEDNLVL